MIENDVHSGCFINKRNWIENHRIGLYIWHKARRMWNFKAKMHDQTRVPFKYYTNNINLILITIVVILLLLFD